MCRRLMSVFFETEENQELRRCISCGDICGARYKRTAAGPICKKCRQQYR